MCLIWDKNVQLFMTITHTVDPTKFKMAANMAAMNETFPKPNQFGARARGICVCDIEVKAVIVL